MDLKTARDIAAAEDGSLEALLAQRAKEESIDAFQDEWQ